MKTSEKEYSPENLNDIEQECFPDEVDVDFPEKERLFNAYVEAMRLASALDYSKLCEIHNEIKGEWRDYREKLFELKSLPNHIMDIIQFQALDECVCRQLNIEPRGSVPFAYDEAKRIIEAQLS